MPCYTFTQRLTCVLSFFVLINDHYFNFLLLLPLPQYLCYSLSSSSSSSLLLHLLRGFFLAWLKSNNNNKNWVFKRNVSVYLIFLNEYGFNNQTVSLLNHLNVRPFHGLVECISYSFKCISIIKSSVLLFSLLSSNLWLVVWSFTGRYSFISSFPKKTRLIFFVVSCVWR